MLDVWYVCSYLDSAVTYSDCLTHAVYCTPCWYVAAMLLMKREWMLSDWHAWPLTTDYSLLCDSVQLSGPHCVQLMKWCAARTVTSYTTWHIVAVHVWRVQGGSNAGHTVIVGDQRYYFKMLPSGIITENCMNVIGECGQRCLACEHRQSRG